MTTQITTIDDAELDSLVGASDPIDVARQHVIETALTPSPVGQVGLELEFHLVDLANPAHRPTWETVTQAASRLPDLPGGSSVTFEPGGQIELSTPPAAGPAAAIGALRADRNVLTHALRALGLGAAALGADPARPAQRINPGPRYAAMERHFGALRCAAPGRAMMTATAALQINLDAGPVAGWTDRLDLIHSLVPVIVAASASSPYLGGRTSGWHSMRQQAWHGIDPRRTDPVGSGGPGGAWADYALDAPVMLVRQGGGEFAPVTREVSFKAWLEGAPAIERSPTIEDLDYHLTTLFPPVRPRGYVEIRCADALPDRWWPALAAVVVTLVDDPTAADLAREACQRLDDPGRAAARVGLDARHLRTVVEECVAIAAAHCPVELKGEVEQLADLITAGRTPSGELRARVEQRGPLRVLEEEAHA